MIALAIIEKETLLSYIYFLSSLIIFRLLAPLVAFTIVFTAIINATLFPDCNRETRDCFLINKFWLNEGEVQ